MKSQHECNCSFADSSRVPIFLTLSFRQLLFDSFELISAGLGRVSAPENIKCKNDECSYKQQVNQAGADKAAEKTNQPQQQQHYKNCP
jgi:hypothetical protein